MDNDSDVSAVLEELGSREPIFHRPEFGTTRADFARMTEEGFWKVGASGRRYSRDVVLDELEKRWRNPAPDVWETSEFRCQRLADDLYLLTYTLVQAGERVSRRSTLWRRSTAGWRIVFHQGTLVSDPR